MLQHVAGQFMAPVPISPETERLRVVLYSEFGAGKTTAAMSFPRPLVVDSDGGLASVAGMQGLKFVPEGFSSLDQLYYWCRDNAELYDTIVIDSFTEAQQQLLREIVEADAADAASPFHRYVPERGEYLANQGQLRDLLNKFRKLGKHMVLTSAVRIRGMQRTPDLTPGVLNVIGYWSSVIGEIEMHLPDPTQPAERWFMVEPTPHRMAKSRFNPLTRARGVKLSQVGEHPTFYELMKMAFDRHFAEIQAATTQEEAT